MQGEASGWGLAQLQARRHWGIPCRYLPQPKGVPEMLGPDAAPRGTGTSCSMGRPRGNSPSCASRAFLELSQNLSSFTVTALTQ